MTPDGFVSTITAIRDLYEECPTCDEVGRHQKNCPDGIADDERD